MNWWDGSANTAWVNSTSAIAQIGNSTPVSNPTITITEDIVLRELRFLAVTTGSILSGQQYILNGGTAGRVLNFGSNGLITMDERSSGGSQFVNLTSNLRLVGENLRIQKYGTGTTFQYLTLGMSSNPNLTGTLTIAGSIYATITAPGTISSLDRLVVEAGGSAPLGTAGANYTTPFSLAGFGNGLAFSGTSYGAIRFTSNNTIISGGILLTDDAGVHTNFSGANATTGILINSAITDNGAKHDFHRFAFTRGNGTLTLAAANTYGGATVLGRALASYSGGITILDFTAATSPQDDILYNGLTTPGDLNIIGGNSVSVLRLVGKSGQTHSQRLGNVTVSGTHSALELQSGEGGAMNLSLGALSHTDLASTLAVTGPASGSITTTQADGFLGPWLTYTSPDYRRSWAKVAGGALANGFAGDTTYATGTSLNAAPYLPASHLTV
ncbi:MAG TPA: filamentous hemagglutinin, partial [Prosthecobacter sp.]|nr:filamentous hemagglutinin [Prosthecobacter sp.]